MVNDELREMAKRFGFETDGGFLTSVQNLKELLKSHHGVMVIGQPMAGKSKALKLIETVMNRHWREEFKEKSNEFLKRKADIYESKGETGAASQASQQDDSHQEEFQGPGIVLTEAETQLVTRTCKNKATFT